MKHIFRIAGQVCCLIVVAGVLIASVIREKPSAHSNGSDITISWATFDESGVQKFEVLRRAGYEGEFLVIAPVEPKGNNSSYQYIDRQVFKASAGLYQYKIRIINGQSPAPETEIVTVSHLSSAAKRTWGSIKAMFR
jgi:hypothetical protein